MGQTPSIDATNWWADEDEQWEKEAADNKELSHVGKAVYHALRTNYAESRHHMWNITRSAMVGPLQQTPPAKVFTENVNLTKEPEHSHTFVDELFGVMSKTTKWCDVMSLAPPTEKGYFLLKMKEALVTIAKTAKEKDPTDPIIVRMMFGFGYGENTVTPAIDCKYWREQLTEGLPEDANIHLWVSAWRYGLSWNHAKMIAVDGKYLNTGGHNLWSETYLEKHPVHDISIEMEGYATHDAHEFANTQWAWVESRLSTVWGRIWDVLPDWVPLLFNRADISEWPMGSCCKNGDIPRFPPAYRPSIVDKYQSPDDAVPVISVGRQAALVDKVYPADDALVVMLDSATKSIRMSLQDLGPVSPTYGWPKEEFEVMAKAMWEREVTIEIVLSNRNLANRSTTSYSNFLRGYSIERVADKIFKPMHKLYPKVTKEVFLNEVIGKKLFISFIRHQSGTTYYQSDIEVMNHPKFIIVDDVCSYTGSQNLYKADLAEWGLIIDDADVTTKMMEDYWNPMWKASFNDCDCNKERVMECIDNDTDDDDDGEVVNPYTFDGRKKMEETVKALINAEAPRNNN